MAIVEVFQNKNDGWITIVPYARSAKHGGANVASGAILRFAPDDFQLRGAEIINEELAKFYVRDSTVLSDLYNNSSRREIERFRAENRVLRVLVYKGEDLARLKVGIDYEVYGDIPFPISDTNLLLKAFSRA